MQTDSRLLGGDSGGPLFDFDGKGDRNPWQISKDLIRTFMFQLNPFGQTVLPERKVTH